MPDDISNVQSFFQSKQIHFNDAWLEGCVNWCKSEILGSNYNLQELRTKVFGQWLLLDLRDAKVPCLPVNISSQKHFTLCGNFCLQMLHVIDISKPKLWQLQKIRNNTTKGNQDVEYTVGTAKRMLQLTLTDGVQEVEAMEFRPINCLSINLAPGTKIRIMGPIVVRRGRLMLEPQNVKVLGGEVDELLVSNAAENVLARILKLPENPNPTKIDEKALVTEKEEENQGYQRITELPKPQPVTPMIIDEESKEIENLMLQAERSVPSSCHNDSKTPDLFEDDDFNPDDFERLDQLASTSTQMYTKKKSPKIKLPSFGGDDDDDVFSNIDIEAHLNEVNRVETQIVTIAKILKERHNITKGTFKIKAKFKEVVEKLTVGEEEYKLLIKIEDGTGDLTVKVHSDLISEFAGYDPKGIQKLKSSVLCKDGTAVEKVMKALKKVKNRLVTLDDVMLITIATDEKPVITKIY